MKREIKFRAWDGNKMRGWESDIRDMNNSLHVKNNSYHKLYYLPMSWLVGDSNDWIWMQYTNLKDKNGKEIYEGDIICYVDDVVVENIGGYDRTEAEGKFLEVKIPDFYFQEGEQIPTADDLEIIGNIYENPELLK